MTTPLPQEDRSLQSPLAWQEAYGSVLQAQTADDLFKWIEVAEPAMLLRRDDLKRKPGHRDEQLEIEEALRVLETIKIGLLNF